MSFPKVVAWTVVALLASVGTARAAQEASMESGALFSIPEWVAEDDGFAGRSLARNEWFLKSLGLQELEPTGNDQEPRPQEDPLDGLSQEEELSREKQGSRFIDFRWLDLELRVGLAVFSEDYKFDPSPAVSLLFRAPLTCMSPDSDPDGEYFGVYVDLSVIPGLDRDLDPAATEPKGTGTLISLGMDYTFVRNQSLLFIEDRRNRKNQSYDKNHPHVTLL